ncbi:MAG: DUF3800 domain-containing protein [Bacilli bacterium]|nr:DUF3800 domain-containing protein [Bacilli bacterium]MDD4734126.1 DUF3800 domain-containing protein [Bacilli bacterium]
MEYKVYCDETCHMQNDKKNYMILGAVYCPKNEVNHIVKYIKNLKKQYGLKYTSEIKWTKISDSKLNFYIELLRYFFINPNLRFRAIICDKRILNHEKFHQTHDEWYHKMYYEMIRYFISNDNNYEIYPDIKDTNSYENFQRVAKYLRLKLKDTNNKTIRKIQPISSNESYILQVTDVLLGALQYHKNGADGSKAKLQIVDFIKNNVIDGIDETTPYNKNKFNILVWIPNETE